MKNYWETKSQRKILKVLKRKFEIFIRTKNTLIISLIRWRVIHVSRVYKIRHNLTIRLGSNAGGWVWFGQKNKQGQDMDTPKIEIKFRLPIPSQFSFRTKTFFQFNFIHYFIILSHFTLLFHTKTNIFLVTKKRPILSNLWR